MWHEAGTSVNDRLLRCSRTCAAAREAGCTNAAGTEVRAGEASVYGLRVPPPHVTSLSSH